MTRSIHKLSVTVIEPNNALVIKNSHDTIFYVTEGKCNIETTFNRDIIIVEKSQDESYFIQSNIVCKIHNLSNDICLLAQIKFN